MVRRSLQTHPMTRPDFPIDEAYLIGGWLASALWGMCAFYFFNPDANDIFQAPSLVYLFSGLYHSYLSEIKEVLLSLSLASSV